MTHLDLVPLLILRRNAWRDVQCAEAFAMCGFDAEHDIGETIAKYELLANAVEEVRNHLAGRSAKQE